MKIYHLTIAAVMAAASLSSSAKATEPLDISDSDVEAASEHLGGGKRTALDNLKARHLDGVKGLTVYSQAEKPPHPTGFSDQNLGLIWQLACSSSVFGIVQLEGKHSFVGKNNEGVFTKLRFKMIDDWRGYEVDNRQSIDIVVSGGETKYKGEVVRFDNPYGRYEVGSQYLLAAGGRRAAQAGAKTWYQNPPFIEVNDGSLNAAPGWTPFPTGTRLKAAKASVAEAMAIKLCAR